MAPGFIGAMFLLSAICSLGVEVAGFADDFKTALSKQTKENFKSFLSLDTGRSSNRLQPLSRNQQQLSPAQWRSLIERLLEVRCSPQQMTILLHYSYRRLAPKPVEDALRNGRLYSESSASTVTACGSVEGRLVKSEEDALVLKLAYGHCCVQSREEGNDTRIYSTTIVVETNASSSDSSFSDGDQRPLSVRQSYLVQCVHPLSRAVEDRPKFSFALSSQKLSGHWTYPHTTNASAYVYLSSNVSLAWHTRQEVYAFPVDCWSSPAVPNAAKTSRKYFVRNGCPDHKLSIIHHFTNGPTKVSIQGSALLFDDAGDDDQTFATPSTTLEKLHSVTLSCDVIPCTHSSTTGLLNIPGCPPSYFCSGKPGAGNNLLQPGRLRGVKRTNVSAGPVTVREVKTQEEATTIDCQLACRRIQPTASPDRSMEPKEYIDGVTLQTAVIIAFASFAFGILFMGALWWVHVRTDPKRLKLLRENYNWRNRSAGDKSATTFTTSTESCLSPRYQTRPRLHDSGCHSMASSQHIREPVSPCLLASTSAKPESDAEESRTDATTARSLLNTLQ